jgi:hypothetical protein
VIYSYFITDTTICGERRGSVTDQNPHPIPSLEEIRTLVRSVLDEYVALIRMRVLDALFQRDEASTLSGEMIDEISVYILRLAIMELVYEAQIDHLRQPAEVARVLDRIADDYIHILEAIGLITTLISEG